MRTPRIISLRQAKAPRHGILCYANVQSRSRGTRVIHTVTGKRRTGKIALTCSCEIRAFNPRVPCIHMLAVAKRMRARRIA